MALAQKIIPNYTYDDYVHWEGRWELIEGHPIAVRPLPIPKHQRVTASLFGSLEMHCKGAIAKNAMFMIL